MEYVDGDRIDRTALRSGKACTAEQIIAYTSQAIEALVEAEELGVIHRDIKPSNMLVTHGGLLKLMDFGIAKVISADPSANEDLGGITRKHTLVGTPAFMSPEQLRGETLDIRSDLYSLGLSMLTLVDPRYEVATGSFREILLQREAGPIRARPTAGRSRARRRLADIIEWLIQPDIADRPTTAADFASSI